MQAFNFDFGAHNECEEINQKIVLTI